jgi:hypothetical protein
MMVWAQDSGEQRQLAPADVQILAQTAKQAAYSFSLGTWCTSKNRSGLQQYAAAVAAWRQRQSSLYWSNSLQNTINPLGGIDLREIRDYILLLPSGQAYRDLPNDGHVLNILTLPLSARRSRRSAVPMRFREVRFVCDGWGIMGYWKRRVELGHRREREDSRRARTTRA